MDDEKARANLRKALFVLRPSLAAAPSSLRIEEEAVALDVTELDVDVLAFEQLARRADPEALRRAVELYQGDLLEGLLPRRPSRSGWSPSGSGYARWRSSRSPGC